MHYFFESGDRLAQGEQGMGLRRFSGRDALAGFFGHQLLNNNISAMKYYTVLTTIFLALHCAGNTAC